MNIVYISTNSFSLKYIQLYFSILFIIVCHRYYLYCKFGVYHDGRKLDILGNRTRANPGHRI